MAKEKTIQKSMHFSKNIFIDQRRKFLEEYSCKRVALINLLGPLMCQAIEEAEIFLKSNK